MLLLIVVGLVMGSKVPRGRALPVATPAVGNPSADTVGAQVGPVSVDPVIDVQDLTVALTAFHRGSILRSQGWSPRYVELCIVVAAPSSRPDSGVLGRTVAAVTGAVCIPGIPLSFVLVVNIVVVLVIIILAVAVFFGIVNEKTVGRAARVLAHA